MTEHDRPCTTTTCDDEVRFVQRVQQELDRSCAMLDGATQSRLNAMRHAALERGKQQQTRLLGWFSLGGLATSCVLVLSFLLLPQLQQQPELQSVLVAGETAAPLEDLDLLTAAEDLGLYEEYEFYQWLATSQSGY